MSSQMAIERRDLRFRSVGTLIMKVTNRCNLDCSYCYENIGRTGDDMTIDLFKSVVARAFHNTSRHELVIVFHGGEPTLLSDEWFRAAAAFSYEVAAKYQKTAKLLAQTNLIKLSDSRIALFNELGISLGVSLDGPETIPTPMRERGRQAFRNFLRAKKAGLSSGVLMTINQSNADRFDGILEWLETEAGIDEFKANVVTPVGLGQDLIPMHHELVFAAWQTILDYMIRTGGRKVIEQNIAEYVSRYFEGKTNESLCNDRVCGAGKGVISVTMHGNLLPCGRFEWNDDEHVLGNFADAEPSHDVAAAKIIHFQSKEPQNWLNCNACEARRICSYGCQAFIVRSRSRVNVECGPTKLLYSYLATNEKKVLPLYASLTALRSQPQLKRRRHMSDGYTDYYKDGFYKDAGGGYRDSYHDYYKDGFYKDAGRSRFNPPLEDRQMGSRDPRSAASFALRRESANQYNDSYHDYYKDGFYKDAGTNNMGRSADPGRDRDFQQERLFSPGSINGLKFHLEKEGVPAVEIDRLANLLAAEDNSPDVGPDGLGSQSKEWVHEMFKKSLAGEWKVDPAFGASHLLRVLRTYRSK